MTVIYLDYALALVAVAFFIYGLVRSAQQPSPDNPDNEES